MGESCMRYSSRIYAYIIVCPIFVHENLKKLKKPKILKTIFEKPRFFQPWTDFRDFMTISSLNCSSVFVLFFS